MFQFGVVRPADTVTHWSLEGERGIPDGALIPNGIRKPRIANRSSCVGTHRPDPYLDARGPKRLMQSLDVGGRTDV